MVLIQNQLQFADISRLECFEILLKENIKDWNTYYVCRTECVRFLCSLDLIQLLSSTVSNLVSLLFCNTLKILFPHHVHGPIKSKTVKQVQLTA